MSYRPPAAAPSTAAKDYSPSAAAPGLHGLIVFALAVVPRLAFAFLTPSFDGDAKVYALVAQNILQNLCVSMSDPATGACAPHWGGNQLPGYPAFIAMTLWLTGGWPLAPLVGQTLAYGAAAAYLARVLYRVDPSRITTILVAAVLALSPTLIAWPRMMMTETLSLAVALWLLATLVRSLQEGRLRVVELGVALTVGFFIRYDFALAAAPVAVVALHIHGLRGAVYRSLVIAVLVAVPVGAWTIRSVAAGLTLMPPFGLTMTNERAPPGVLRWMRTWVVSQYELANSVWPLVTGDYGAIRAPARAYRSAEEEARAHALLSALAQQAGTPVSAELDAEFVRLAIDHARRDPLGHFVMLPLQRAFNMWLSPYPSMGWPIELGTAKAQLQEKLHSQGVRSVLSTDYALPVMMKGLVAGWRYSVLLLLGTVIVWSVIDRRLPNAVLALALVLALARTLPLALIMLIESRYLLPALAWLEIALAMEIGRRFWRRG